MFHSSVTYKAKQENILSKEYIKKLKLQGDILFLHLYKNEVLIIEI